jgi:hypothetical protein
MEKSLRIKISSYVQLSLDAHILLDHAPADWVVKVPVFRECLQCHLPACLVQGTEQWTHKLHATDLAQEFRGSIDAGRVAGLQSHEEVRRLELHVLGVEYAVDLAQKLGSFWAQRLRLLECLEDDELLGVGEGLDIFSARLKGLFIRLVW